MATWPLFLAFCSFFVSFSNAQYNSYNNQPQRYQYGNSNNNINSNPQIQPNRQYNANPQRYNAGLQNPQQQQQQQLQQQQQQYYAQQQQHLQQQQQQQLQQQQQMNNYGQNQYRQNQYGQNQYQQNQGGMRNSGSGSGLLGNPLRPSNFAFGNSSSPDGKALFMIRITSYSIGRIDPACAITTCSYSFSIVMATLSATVNYESSSFYPLNGSSLAPGDWQNEIYLNVTTKPVSVDIFVHSRGLTIGQVDGNYSLGVPVQHVNTFVLDLRDYMPSGQNGTVVRNNMQLQDSKPSGNTGASISVEYFIQCLNGYLGPNCDYTCNRIGNGNIAQCKSVSNPKEQQSCRYDSSFTQIAQDSCEYCSQGFTSNGTCLPVGYTSEGNVSHGFKVATIILGVLLGLALVLLICLIAITLICLKRARERQQYPQYRNESSLGYRPNAASGETPLLGGSEEKWERERRPAAIIRQSQQTTEVETPQESFQDNRYGNQRREAQV